MIELSQHSSLIRTIIVSLSEHDICFELSRNFQMFLPSCIRNTAAQSCSIVLSDEIIL